MANDSADKLNTVKHDTKDTVDEIKHRAQAAGEHLKRDVRHGAANADDKV